MDRVQKLSGAQTKLRFRPPPASDCDLQNVRLLIQCIGTERGTDLNCLDVGRLERKHLNDFEKLHTELHNGNQTNNCKHIIQ